MNLPRPFGEYTLVRKLAVGGMAEIYAAKTRGLGGFEKMAALKLVHPHLSADPAFVQMLIDEAKILVLLTHANVAQVFDLGCMDGTYFISMEYVEGIDIHGLQKAVARTGTLLPVPLCCYVVAEVLNGLDYAHRKRDASGKPLNIVHRDVSPQNVLISHAGEVKLVDFGIAKTNLRGEGTEVGIIKGKYYYMSPEQAWADPMDRRSDIFSAGIVLYEMLVGRMLYTARTIPELIGKVREAEIDPPEQLRPDVPAKLSKIVMRALAREPADRYQSALDMGEALRDFLYETAPSFTAGKLAQYVAEVLERAAKVEPAAPGADQTGGLGALKRSEFVHGGNSVVFPLPDRVLATRNEALPAKTRPRGATTSSLPVVAAESLRASRTSIPVAGDSLPALPKGLSAAQIAPPARLSQVSQADPQTLPPPSVSPARDSAPPTEIMIRPPELMRVSGWPLDAAAANDPGLDEPTELWNAHERQGWLEAASAGAVQVAGGTTSQTTDDITSKYEPSAAVRRAESWIPSSGPPATLPSITPLPGGPTPALVPPPGEDVPMGSIPPSPALPEFPSQPTFRRTSGGLWLSLAIAAACLLLGVALFEAFRPVTAKPTLEIVSVPASATVLVDGMKQPHRTPIKLAGLEADRSYELRVELPGYYAWEATYRASAGAVRHIAVLSPIMAEVHVTSTPSGAQVSLDDVAIGRTPLTISSLPVGRKVRLRAALPGYDEARQELVIQIEELKPTVAFELTKSAPRSNR